jgi:hypothetical protein
MVRKRKMEKKSLLLSKEMEDSLEIKGLLKKMITSNLSYNKSIIPIHS